MTSLVETLAFFQFIVGLIGALIASLGALYYFRRVRMERPAIGRFNGRDVGILFGFLIALPAFYLLVPRWALTTLLVLTFMAALSIGFRQLVNPTTMWVGIGLLVGGNLWLGQHALGTLTGWTLFWAETSIVVMLAAISVANLYVQGGMQLRHVAYFALGLAAYDAIFTLVWPITNYLVREFVGYPLFPAVGMRVYYNEAITGLGDLLVYAAFMIAAFKAYGRRAIKIALPLIVFFGSIMPPLSAVIVIDYIDARSDIIIPAQTWFGPAAFIAYLWMRKHWGKERTTAQFIASSDAVAPRTAPVPATAPAAAQGREESGRPELDVAVPH